MVITYSLVQNPIAYRMYADGEVFAYQNFRFDVEGFVPFADAAEARKFALQQIAEILNNIEPDPAQPEDPEVPDLLG